MVEAIVHGTTRLMDVLNTLSRRVFSSVIFEKHTIGVDWICPSTITPKTSASDYQFLCSNP